MKQIFVIILLICTSISVPVQGQSPLSSPDKLMGNRFLTFNTIIRVNQIEVSRDRNEGLDERSMHTPERVIAFHEAISSEFPEARITWAFSWLALHDMSDNYKRSGNWLPNIIINTGMM